MNKQRLISVFKKIGTATASFIKTKRTYLALFLGVAAIGASSAIILSSAGNKEQTNEPPSSSSVSQSGDEKLSSLLPTPAPSISPSPSPIPDFTKAPVKPQSGENKLVSAPVKGDIIWGFAVDELIYSKTLDQWMTHPGVDIASPKGSEVLSSFSGTVSAVYKDSAYGVSVEIESEGDIVCVYANLKEEVPVKEGSKVSKGDVIGYIGTSATSECALESHLHFALYKNGKAVNPNQYVFFTAGN